MSILKWLAGPSPEKLEARGDALFAAGRFGPAKLEYEHALHRLTKQSPDAAGRPRLEDKILRARHNLAIGHKEFVRISGYICDSVYRQIAGCPYVPSNIKGIGRTCFVDPHIPIGPLNEYRSRLTRGANVGVDVMERLIDFYERLV